MESWGFGHVDVDRVICNISNDIEGRHIDPVYSNNIGYTRSCEKDMWRSRLLFDHAAATLENRLEN